MQGQEIQTYSHEQEIMLQQPGFTPEQIVELEKPLDATLIRQRPDGKKFLKGSTEFDTANKIFGYGRWGYRVLSRELRKSYDLQDNATGMYFYVEIELFIAGAMFPMHGDGGQTVKYYTPQGFEDASKGATTDAVKRALKNYGPQFGLPLYDEDALVDIGDGVLEKVKNVQVSKDGGAPKAKRTIDSQPPDPTIKAANDGLYNAVLKAKQRALSQGVIRDDQQWEALLDNLEITKFVNGADIAKLNGKITQLEKMPKQQTA